MTPSGPPPKEAHPLRLVFRHIRPYRWRYAAGLLLLLVTNALAAAVPWLMKRVFESLEMGERAWAYIGGIVAVALAMAVVRTGSRICVLGASRLVAADLRETVFAHLQQLPRSFYDRARTGDLLSRVTGDVQLMRGLTGFGLMNMMNTALALLFAVIMMLRIDPALTLFAFLPYVLIAGVARQLSRRVFRRTFVAQERLAALVSFVTERLSGFSVVRTFGREDETIQGFNEQNQRYLDASLSLVRARGAMVPLFTMVGGVGTMVILWLGGGRVASGAFSLGDFVAATGYLTMAAWPSMAAGWIINLVQRASAAAKRLNEVLSTPPARSAEQPTGVPLAAGGIALAVRGLSFAYGERRHRARALEDVSFNAAAGEIVGITGPVGAGKSTLTALLLRQYEVERGSIELNGIDLRDIPVGELRRRVIAVPQLAFLFNRSLRENIGFGRSRELSNDELERAAELAGLTRIKEELPAGFETIAGERGNAVSGGQRQRAALARALACEPDLLILDDPFAAVDAATEDEVLGRLRDYLTGRTVLLVSHRSTSLRITDRIIVLDAGRVVQEGSHEELVAAGGVYARLHERTVLERALEEAS